MTGELVDRETAVFNSGLSVFFPAFNDAPSLPGLIRATFDTLRGRVDDFEVIVINDGSSDETGRVLSELEQEFAPHLRIITHARNLGYGAALRSGFQAATKDYIFYTDGDGQYDPRELEQLLRAAAPDVGLVNGYKTERNDPWHRIAIGWLYNRFARWLFRIHLRDIDCDFRLIKRSAFEPGELQSTSGTICVELVRNLELAGLRVVELPVNHFARQHGRSQFFRVRSLATTFIQLLLVFWRLVLGPALRTEAPAVLGRGGAPSVRQTVGTVGLLFVLTAAAYGWALHLPFIGDDYVQIQLSREFGPLEKWSVLAQDALYRCRATSLVMTYWIERALGLDPIYYNLTSLLLHVANSVLVFALGVWRPIGWRISAVAALFFAVSERHSEAVVWFAAVPELLVFFFVLGSFLFWILWMQEQRLRPLFYGAAFACYLAALLSKESAVAIVPLCALTAAFQPQRSRWTLLALTPFALVAAAYFGMTWAARDTHLHFNDGTFSLQAPVTEVVVRSAGGLLWVWGMVVLVGAYWGKLQIPGRLVFLSLAWMVLTLLPYSFLTYMPRVPSRHTYMASVGLALLVAAGFYAFRSWAASARKQWLVPAITTVILVHQCGYLWTVLQHRYRLRAEPTEHLLRVVRQHHGPINASCFPYSPLIAEYAFLVTRPSPKPSFAVGKESAQAPDAVDFCNEIAEGVRY